MPEPVTTLGLVAIAAYLGKDGIQKLLGPTAGYLGEGLRDFAQKRAENVGKIFKNADDKLGEKRETEGIVPPKVLKTIINDGSYNDDDVAVEYLGGILASSRTEMGRDDRGARIAKLLDNLSTYQLRAHYLIYSTIKDNFTSQGYQFDMNDRKKMELFIPHSHYAVTMGYSVEEEEKSEPLLRHTLFGLQNDGLIDTFQYGSKEHMLTRVASANSDGLLVQPSALGAELFLWAFGEADKPLSYIFDQDFHASIEGLAETIPETIATQLTDAAD